MAMPEWVKKELRDNFAKASRAGRRAARAAPRAATAAYRARDEALHVKLTNGAAFTIPVKLIPALARAAARDIGTVEVLGRGGGPKERPQGRPATGAGGSRPSLGPDGRRGDYISCERRSSPTSRPLLLGRGDQEALRARTRTPRSLRRNAAALSQLAVLARGNGRSAVIQPPLKPVTAFCPQAAGFPLS